VLTRHTNAVFLALVPLYGIASWRDLPERGAELWRRRSAIVLMMIVAVVCVLPQLAIYRVSTGSWLVNAYAPLGVGFNFQSPHLWGVLFSTEKGLFFWSPVLLLAIWGVVAARSTIRPRELVIPAVFILTVNTYLIASWSDWQFGGSYGHRAFTDGFAIVAPLMAASFAWFAERPRLGVGVTVAASAAVMLSVFQMIQYWGGLVPFSGTTWAQYRSIFLKLP
jgi:hypothetical protein